MVGLKLPIRMVNLSFDAGANVTVPVVIEGLISVWVGIYGNFLFFLDSAWSFCL